MEATTDLTAAPDTRARGSARRVQFRAAIADLAGRARSGDIVRMLLLPGAVLLVGGFAAMFLGWWGASRSHREIEQLPYLISGGLIGLGMVVVGGLLLASVMWIGVLQRLDDSARRRTDDALTELEARLRAEMAAATPPPAAAPAQRSRRRPLHATDTAAR